MCGNSVLDENSVLYDQNEHIWSLVWSSNRSLSVRLPIFKANTDNARINTKPDYTCSKSYYGNDSIFTAPLRQCLTHMLLIVADPL